MKFLFSHLLVFSFLCLQSQLPNCDNYEEEKQKYETLFGDMKSMNYDDLPKVIIENFDLKKFDKENLVIFYINGDFDICGYPAPSCTSFYPVYPINEEKIWTAENIILLQKKIKKNIIPKTEAHFISTEDSFSKKFKTSNSAKGIMKLSKEIYYPNTDREFYYLPYNSKKLLLTNNGHFYKEANTLKTIITNINSKKIKVEYRFEDDDKKNYSHIFEHLNNQWNLIETKN
ncbi:hypothetical protein [Epilithonimonas xixisoli]|uniref:Uncharacterized protein n=1 Tax=Epilithonimonas xixisoli TaxID=1476462 RepID=A0A4R8I7E7_9FLAO|nr:hypothetical protein [Epilithonimonas xixisoli]TDX84903.1 hypothetical protein B0I22_2544 [Epilithonimonas xixisoli]